MSRDPDVSLAYISYVKSQYLKIAKRYKGYLLDAAEEEDEREFVKTFLRLLVHAYIAGGLGVSFFASIPYSAFEISIYSPDQYAFLIDFVANNWKDVIRRLPSALRRQIREKEAFFMPDPLILNTMLAYAMSLTQNFLAARAEILERYGKLAQKYDTLCETYSVTETTRGFNVGLIASVSKVNEVAEEKIVGFRFVAILDDRTSRYCRPRANMFIPVEDVEKMIRNSPPLHPHCRSTLVPTTVPGPEIDDTLLPQPPYFSPQAELVDLALKARRWLNA